MSNLDRFRDIEDYLNTRFFERQDAIRGLLIGLLARQHIFFMGPPGEAKTELAMTLAKLIDGQFFSWLLTATTSPDEVFGAPSIPRYVKDGVLERNTKHKLPEAKIALLDEFFNSNSAVLNNLLNVLNERIFYNGLGSQEVPLEFAVLASNVLPEEGEGLEAIWDRIGLKYIISPIEDERAFLQMIQRTDLGLSEAVAPILNLSELGAAQAEVQAIDFGRNGYAMHRALRRVLLERHIQVSDRKYSQTILLLKANAYLEGRDHVAPKDYQILAHVFWRDEEDKEMLDEVIRSLVLPYLTELQKMEERLTVLSLEIIRMPDGEQRIKRASEANAKCLDAMRLLGDYIQHSKTPERRMYYQTKERLKYLNCRLADITLNMACEEFLGRPIDERYISNFYGSNNKAIS
ncbi:MAG TPA: AAA family ATPase [Desulfosporosinus sp.]|nr:AAA family ATPase [Desulfosporosinus sp.]